MPANLKKKEIEIAKILSKFENGNLNFLDDVKEEYRYNPQIVLKALEINGNNLSYVSNQQKADKELVKVAVKHTPSAFQFADISLKSDFDFLSEIIKTDANAVEFFDDEFKKNKEFALEAVKNKASSIRYFDEKLRNDDEIITKAIQEGLVNDNYPTFLEYLPKKYQDNKNIVTKILELNGLELEFASNNLKDDLDCVITAVRRNEYAIKHSSDKFKSNLNCFIEVLLATKKSHIVEFFSDDIRDNEKAFLEAAKFDGLNNIDGKAGGVIKFASDRLKCSKDFLMEFIEIAPFVLDYIPKDIAKDKDIKLKAKKY